MQKSNYLTFTFIFSFAIAIIFPVYNIFYLYPTISELFVEENKHEVIQVAKFIESSLFSNITTIEKKYLPPNINKKVNIIKKRYHLYKIKFYSPAGEVVYSSNSKDIGQVNKKDYFHKTLAKGNPVSKYLQKGDASFEGSSMSFDRLELYFPIMNKGKFTGAIEIYTKARHIKKKLDEIISYSSILLFFISVIFLYIITYNLMKTETPVITQKIKRINISYPIKLMLILILAIFSLELGVMYILHLSHFQPIFNAFIDSLMLIAVLFPLIYILVSRPMSLEIVHRKHAETMVNVLNQELEQRVLQRTAQLESANNELESFAYSVSHDLRAPLRSIKGFSQAILEDYKDKLDAQGQDYLNRVCVNTQRMAEIIDDMLILSRVTRSKMSKKDVNLSTLADTIIREHRDNHPERIVEYKNNRKIIVHNSDPHLLQQVMQNLLNNAWKFTRNTDKPIIEFGTTLKDGKTAYFVRDNGVGFDMEYYNKLFDPFQRLHNTSDFEGNGIGLATVKRIIERHGGQVWGESEVGKGATFYFTLT